MSKNWSEIYEKRPLSMLVRTMLNMNGFSNMDVAEKTRYSLAYFNNKMNRNSFSVKDLAEIGEICGFTLYLDSNFARLNVTELLKEK